MKIREIHLERLFSFGKYQNERIGLTATIDDGENPDKAIGDLNEKILKIEDCLKAYRDIEWVESNCEMKARRTAESVANRQSQLEELKITLAELSAKGENGDVDARLQHASSSKSYKSITEELESYKQLLVKEERDLEKARMLKTEIHTRVKNGRLDITDLPLPEVPQQFQVY